MLDICEIFISIQGESTQCGRLCSFVRLFGCNLRCRWCDTAYACGDGAAGEMSVDEVIGVLENIYANGGAGIEAAVNTGSVGIGINAAVKAGGGVTTERRLVEITGGEPLLQPSAVTLCDRLLALGYEVMIETNGSQDISAVPEGVRRVVDVKCPGSGSGGSFLADNLNHIRADDELKFVLASIEDAAWARNFCGHNGLIGRCPVIFSPATPLLPCSILAGWMVESRLSGVRLGVQLHKAIWGDRRGV